MASLPFPQRLVALGIVFAALSVWHFRRDPYRWKECVFVFGAGIVGGFIGILNDVLTSSISRAYFEVGKGLPADDEFLASVVALGFQAGFVAGAIGSCVLLYASNPTPHSCRLSYSLLCRYLPYPVMAAVMVGSMFGFAVQFVQPYPLVRDIHPLVTVQHAGGFLTVWAIHLGLYLGLVIGVAVAVSRIRGQRALSLPNSPLHLTAASGRR